MTEPDQIPGDQWGIVLPELVSAVENNHPATLTPDGARVVLDKLGRIVDLLEEAAKYRAELADAHTYIDKLTRLKVLREIAPDDLDPQ